ncbi:MAG: PstS family phosphate ABC transporter substrate-binding protein [Synechococcales cyanobacterium RU_4_20]|nr:PstS family phosphate ABC transporter substrate-binding protein [Synechococcales cyanobacterium RU_4_20]NJR67647.1 PstS family phosphate ABC transporter substrate-binding protein [Synechococcales cyanobacterium CRU_2_2]
MNTLKKVAAASALVGAVALVPVMSVAQSSKIVKIDGSSTVFPITERVAEGFQKANKAVKVTVGVSGTGGGFKKFCAGETDVANASRPIKDSEKKLCAEKGIKYVELAVALDALTVVVNKKNTAVSNLTTAELKKMWAPEAQGKVTTWNQVRAGLPKGKMRLFGPGADSGTFDYFTEEINGKAGSSRKDYTASEDDNTLVRGVENDANGIGYFGYAYYLAHKDKLKAVSINGVQPSDDNVLNGKYKPLSRPLYIYVSQKAAKKAEVRSFVEYYLSNAGGIVDKVGYVPYKAASYQQTLGKFKTFK